MQDSRHEFSGPAQPLTRESGEAMQAFVGRHRDFFVFLAVMVAQLLLLSVQITRGQNVRLIQVWTVTVLRPFEISVQWAVSSTRNSWNHWSGLWSAQEENAELRRELASAQTRLQHLSGQASEANSLRALLDLKTNLPMQTVAADVIAVSPGVRSGAIYIDKGSEDGLSPDLPVLTPEGVVGKTFAVFAKTSQILLITDPSSGVGAMLEKTGVEGVVRGGQKLLPELHYIANREPVMPGDRIVTSGLDKIFPRGLNVGVVVKTSRGDPFRNILVQPAAPLDRLQTVLVVKKLPAGQPNPKEAPRR